MSRHEFGFAVKVLGDGGLPSHDARRWQSGPHLAVSLDRLEAILGYLSEHEIGMYRMPSGLAPYASHPDLPQFHGQLAECSERLAEVGSAAERAGVRLSFHPGQYTVLNSERDDVRAAAVADLEVQAGLLDALGAPPEAVVVIHVGGAAGGKPAGIDRFHEGFELLSPTARSRLVIENDDRTYALSDALEVSERCGIPVVWDAHHHRCLDPDGIADREALRVALATWPDGVRPKIHFSSPRLDAEEKKRKRGRNVEHYLALPELRAHADLVDLMSFEFLLEAAADVGRDFDVMIEAKAKDLALLRLRDQLKGRGFSFERGELVLS